MRFSPFPFLLSFLTILFSVIFRYTNYHEGIWIIGVFSVVSSFTFRTELQLLTPLPQVIGAAILFIHPIPKSQRGGAGYMST